MTGEKVMTKVDESFLPKFKTKIEKDTYLKEFLCWKQEENIITKED